jgi:hypothetical protein
MSKIIWELHVAGKDTGFEDCIRTFDSKQEAIEYVDAVRDNPSRWRASGFLVIPVQAA